MSLESIGRKWKNLPLWGKITSGALFALLAGALYDGYIVVSEKYKDRLYESIKLENPSAKTLEEQNKNNVLVDGNDTIPIKDFFHDVLANNSNIINVKQDGNQMGEVLPENQFGLTPEILISIMTGENALKSGSGFALGFDHFLESLLIERSSGDKTLLGKGLSKIVGTGSYGWFQTQREAINAYRDDPETFDRICDNIASFKMPNNKGEWEELYKQFGYEKKEDMVSDIKNLNIDINKGKERYAGAYGFVLLDQLNRRRAKSWEGFDEEKAYKFIEEIIQKVDQEEYRHGEHDLVRNGIGFSDLKTFFLLNKRGDVSFNDISNMLKSDEFSTAAACAERCTKLEAARNCYYLMILSIAELNEYISNKGNGELKITTPNGTFGPTSAALAKKHLKEYFKHINKPFPDEIENGESSDIKKYLNEHEDIFDGFRDWVLSKYIENMRLFYKLGDTKDKLNNKQVEFLQKHLDVSFEHLYVGVNLFKQFLSKSIVIDNGYSLNDVDYIMLNNRDSIPNPIKIINNAWNNYVNSNDTESLNSLKGYMTNKDEFIKLTRFSEKEYDAWMSSFGAAMIGTTYTLSQTKHVTPDIYEEGGFFSNKKNTRVRYVIGGEAVQNKKAEDAKGDLYIVKGNEIDSLKNYMLTDSMTRYYIRTRCRRKDGEPIASPQDIPDELVYQITGLKRDQVEALGEGDSVRFQIDNVKQFSENQSEVKKAEVGDNFQKIIFKYQEENPIFAKILRNLIGKNQIKQEDIDKNIIGQLIRHKDGSEWKNVSDLKDGDEYIIVWPSNKSPESKNYNIVQSTQDEELEKEKNQSTVDESKKDVDRSKKRVENSNNSAAVTEKNKKESEKHKVKNDGKRPRHDNGRRGLPTKGNPVGHNHQRR